MSTKRHLKTFTNIPENEEAGRNIKREPQVTKNPKKIGKKRNLIDTEEVTDDILAVETKQKKIKLEVADCKSLVKLEHQHLWNDYELLAENQNLSHKVAKATIKLFDEGNTIPFIARYRRDVTENLTPEQLRDVKEEYEKINVIKSKAETILKNVEKLNNFDSSLKKAILNAQSLEELEHLYAPYKPGIKRSLAERAKALGLEKHALDLIAGQTSVHLTKLVDADKEGLKNETEVEKGLIHIIASVIATDIDLLSFIRKLRSEVNFGIETKKSSSKKSSTATSSKDGGNFKQKNEDEMKFATYFDFHCPVKFIKPHQTLAINRGESMKILSVKIVVPDYVFNKFSNFCTTKWINAGKYDDNRKRILCAAVKDSYSRLVQPYIIRELRTELKTKAEKASYEVFSSNLKQLLLVPPVKGKNILGIDPGFSNGCKLAIISETGTVLRSTVVYPHKKRSDKDVNTLKELLLQHNIIALGNGTACRETETWLTEILQDNVVKSRNVRYTVINESGASIYSCSPEAKKEFPNMDPNIISAVSLARRLQDPLAELVKVEPKHLGVGMYQHDLPKKQLEKALSEVVMECVSFVGVDLNTASQCLLRRIAGLTDKRATQIIEHRTKNGTFVFRKQLLDVSGIGARVFEQCAGFLRVGPNGPNLQNEFYKIPNTNRLDCTYIHPESYDVADKIIKKLKLNVKDVGKNEFINSVKTQTMCLNVEELSRILKTPTGTINLILDALSKPLNFDCRSECSQEPLFKKGVVSIQDLEIGNILTGSVNNVTHFGCFVDVGVGSNGLIHQSKMRGFDLKIGERVSVKVVNLDTDRNRIGLEMINKL